MEVPKVEVRVRVSGEVYKTFPDGHRNAFVVGALDMLCFAYLYAAPEHKARLDAMIGYAGKYDIGALTHQFDEFLNRETERIKYGAAGTFFLALIEWSGFDKK